MVFFIFAPGAVAADAGNPFLAPPRPNTNLPTLTTVRQVVEMSATEAQRQYPVKLTAVVTYFDSFWKTMFVQDATAGTWVYRTFHETNFHAGDVLELNGASDALFGPAIKPAALRVLGAAPLPEAVPTSFERLLSGRMDGQRVLAQGVIRSMGFRFGLLEIHMHAGNDRIVLYLPGFADRPLPAHLIGARIEAQGVCSMMLNKDGLIIGFWFYVNDLAAVKVLRAATASPFGEPPQTISSLRRYDARATFGDRATVAGVVKHWLASGRATIRDATRALPVYLRQPWPHNDPRGRYLDPPPMPALRPGDQVVVAGYVSTADGRISLVDAECQVRSRTNAPEAKRILATEALNPDLDSELVSVDGRLIERESRQAGGVSSQVLLLQSGNLLFEAELTGAKPSAFAFLNKSVLRVTGVNTVQVDPLHRSRFFRLLLRSPEDVRVLRAAPRWTLRDAARLGAVLVVISLGSLVWIAVLRRRVAARTASLRIANEQLRAEVAEREGAEHRLQQALVTEQELGRLKSSFISMVSHEIRTPLALILSSSEILNRYLDRLPQEKRQRQLETIDASVKRMSLLVEDVLLFSRAEAGRLEFKPAPLDLKAFARSLADELESTTHRRCPIRLNLPAAAEPVRLDESLVRHILTNLLTNAVKYSRPGSPVLLDIAFEESEVRFCVRDEGIGIPEVDLKHLFTPFHRSRNTASTPGTGLGLVIVKRCVERHGGRIELESREGAGTTVTVRLPVYSPGHTEIFNKPPSP